MKEMIGPNCGVTVLGRSGMRYREGARTIHVDGEMRNGSFDFAVFQKSIQAWEGSGDPIDDGERKRIVANIVAAFTQNGMKVAVE